MSNHPNRSKQSSSPGGNPTPKEVAEAREKAGLTQTDAARVIYCTLRAWQDWEGGQRRMHPAFIELFRIKTGQIKAPTLQRGS